MITFDQWIDVIVQTSEPEAGFDIQQDVHGAASLIFEWKAGNITNAQIIEAFNFDAADGELTTVKTHLNGLTNAETLALQAAMDLAAKGIAITGVTYDKALLRTRFGL
jgi:hypothetical protein